MSPQAFDSYTAIRRKHLNGTLPEWLEKVLLEHGADPKLFDPATKRETWFDAADRNIAIARRHGRFPSGASDDEELHSAGQWWARYRHAFKADRLTPEKAAYLTDRLPGWEAGNDSLWRIEADRNINVVSRLGKFPSAASTDEELSVVGQWWSNRRHEFKTGRMASEKSAYLTERLPGWEDGNDALWRTDADRNIAVVTRHGKFPSTKSPDAELRGSGIWWVNRRQELKTDRLGTDRAKYLSERLPGWELGNRSRVTPA